jgi:predicted lipoprotein with Yx(FWY)xxD motif
MTDAAGVRVNTEDVMTVRKLLFGAATLALLAAPAFAAGEPADIKTMDINGQKVLTDAKGMTLYTYDKDTAGVSNCYGKCATAWPPAYVSEGATATGAFTIVQRKDDKPMWAYDGKPLYLWVKDTKPGDTTGDMVGNVWHTAVEK